VRVRGAAAQGVRWLQALEAGCIPLLVLAPNVRLIPPDLAPRTEAEVAAVADGEANATLGGELSRAPPIALRASALEMATADGAAALLARLRRIAAQHEWVDAARRAGAAALQRARWDADEPRCQGAFHRALVALRAMSRGT
jgi:hypothetical protein